MTSLHHRWLQLREAEPCMAHIPVEDGNHRTTLGLNNTTSGDQRKVGDLMAIYSTHINSARRCRAVDDTDVGTSKATISTTVNQRSKRRGLVLRDMVSHMVHIDLAVVLAIQRNDSIIVRLLLGTRTTKYLVEITR